MEKKKENMKFLTILLIFCAFFREIHCVDTLLQKYYQRFHPQTIQEGDHVARKYPKHRMEVTSSFGMTEDTILFIEAAVEENFTGRFDTEAMNKIQETIQGHLGGYWGVQFYEDPYMFFSTSFKRSPSFVVLDVDGSGVAIVKDS